MFDLRAFAPYRTSVSSTETPLRSEILTREGLAEYARTLASHHRVSSSRFGRSLLLPRFEENNIILERAYLVLSKAAENKDILSSGAAWLLDNYHVIKEQVRDIRRDFPQGYYNSLPKLTEGEHKKYPRVYHIALEIIMHTDATIDSDLVAGFVSAYQSRSVLASGELWAIPIMLRFALIENLRRLTARTLEVREKSKFAEELVEEIVGAETNSSTDILLLLASKLNENPDFLPLGAVSLMRRLREKGSKSAITLQWLETRLKEQGHDPEEMARTEHYAQAANQASIGNTVTSLKLVNDINWREWFEAVSLVHKTLLNDPAHAYAHCDFITRDQYRHKIERLARGLKVSEVEIAERTVELAKSSADSIASALTMVDSDTTLRFSHVGYYLVDKGQEQLEQHLRWHRPVLQSIQVYFDKNAFAFYSSSIVTLSIVLTAALCAGIIAAGGTLFEACVGALLFLFPFSELATNIIQWCETHGAIPKPLPKLDFESGIPTTQRTMVAVQTIVHDPEAIARAVAGLEVRFLANSDPNLFFSLLVDLQDAPQETMPGDEHLINYAEQLITELNEQHSRVGDVRFYLLIRRRVWNECEHKFMGWERKRGKISEFNRLLSGSDDTTLRVHIGDLTLLRTIKYVITLDGDSSLPRGVARKLIGTLAHPLNRPVFDEKTNVVCQGYSVIQPRVSIGFSSANNTYFSSLFSGDVGLDPYTQLVSDVYQDLFQEGSYIGKGIYDVRAFERALENRVPENSLLSHDLFEGCFARVALATDIEIFDDFPSRYDVYAKRLYRWVRGDWQLLPWIFHRVPDAQRVKCTSPISKLGRWKLADNLRRSLVAPSCFLFICFALAALPLSPFRWLIFVVLVIAFPVFGSVLNALINPPRDVLLRGYLRNIAADLLKHSLQAILKFVFLPFQAFCMVRAIITTLVRVICTKKNLLEWETAYYAEQRAAGSLTSFLALMAPAVILSISLTGLMMAYAPDRLIYGAPFVLLWSISPFVAYWLSKPLAKVESKLTSNDRARLLQIGAETWRYFDQLITAEHNYLVPDNIQLAPRVVVAERTSPTNISLSILSTISAYDMGFIPLTSAVDRLTKTFGTLAKLERFHGHFLNWYNTKTLAPLQPRYVSTVDSGNLVGHLIAARIAFVQFLDSPFLSGQNWEYLRMRVSNIKETVGVSDASLKSRLAALQDALARTPTNAKTLHISLAAITLFVTDVASALSAKDILSRQKDTPSELEGFIAELRQLLAVKDFLAPYFRLEESISRIEPLLLSIPEEQRPELRHVYGQLQHDLEEKLPTPALVADMASNLSAILLEAESLDADARQSVEIAFSITELKKIQQELEAVSEIAAQIKDLTMSANTIVEDIEFEFLYDSTKELFSIGFHIDSSKRDNSFYDLLASECRLSSFVAIAMGAVPQKHWFSLGRSLVTVSGSTALVSWSGTMFEYLMPLLVMRDFAGTLLSKTCHVVVKVQQAYGHRRGVPWGVSESAYSVVDFEKTYQYKAFGVPALGLKRGLADDFVVSPYSTFLALMIDPVAALKNVTALEHINMRGEYGFYEAIDFTPERLSSEEQCHVIQSYLAHHQGMTLVAINNVLHRDIMVERFHSDPRVQATDLLLQERFPHLVPVSALGGGEVSSSKREEEEERVSKGERFTTPHTYYPRTRVLSNGHYSIMVDNAGNGFSSFGGDLMLTRWREDGVAGQYGSYIFIRDLDSGKLWSVAYQPTRIEPESYEVLFSPDKIEFIRRDFGILLHTAITVSPEENVEVRQVTLTNLSNRKRNLEITSYAEVALAFARADVAHPAFSKMFIETQYLPELEAIVFSRRPRSLHEEQLFLMHMLTLKTCWEPTQCETSRMEFLGRGNSIGSPAIFETRRSLSGSTGAVLDPVCSLRARVELQEGQTEIAVFSTGFAKTREDIVGLAERYHDLRSVTRAFEMAWSHNNIELRREEYSIRQVHAFQRLLTTLMYNVDAARGKAESLINNRLTQSGFWRFGVSGDLPIVFLRVNDPAQISLVKELLLAHQYIRMRGIIFDLVILNEYPGGYFQNFQEELEFLVRSGYIGGLVDQKGGVFLRTAVQLSAEEITLLEAIARVLLLGERGTLSAQLVFEKKPIEPISRRRIAATEGPETASLANVSRSDYEFFNGMGGFVEDGKTYQLELSGRRLPPLPWSNVIANRDFGFLVSESGSGYTWSENSRENKITPWHNDPVSDPVGEAIYLRDSDQGSYWSPTPKPVSSRKQFQVRHSFGESEFRTVERGVESALTLSGSPTEKVKWWHLKLKNRTEKERRLEAYLYVEWTLGIQREDSIRSVVTNFDKQVGILYACNHYNNEFAGRVVFVGSNLPVQSYTTSRHEFIGRHGDTSAPRGLEVPEPTTLTSLISAGRTPAELSKKVGVGFDSCAVLKVQVHLAPGEEREALFYLGEGSSIEDAKKRAPHFRSVKVRTMELAHTKEALSSTLGAVQVTTPDRAFDILLNGWLLYQTLVCRIYGRSAVYQSGGAMGFRDQLQDVMALLYSRPDLARAQILVHAGRQFREGDVQHWWHPPSGRGVRTRISDDYLWLPYVVHRYLEVTGDVGVLDEQIHFIDAQKLEEHQMEAYLVPHVSPDTASLYDHCAIALDRALSFGEHGLPFMGAGDWNDGMNEVGKDGKGESVWLGWFLSDCLTKFASVCQKRGDDKRAAIYMEKAQALVHSIEQNAWDGEWYRRAFFDNGTPLGSAENDECKIDSLCQSWSVITGSGEARRRATAMDAVRRELVRPEDKLICLLAPPFDHGTLEPGYIKGYLPGVRENGGQYTHAAAWVIMATALQGRGKEAFELFSMINPINHTLNPGDVQRYQGEPYVLCGDVYSRPPLTGRAGWSWYTGSAGWMYRVGIEYILGLKVTSEYFTIDPCVPPSWKEFSITYRAKNVLYEIEVKNPDGVEKGVVSVEVGGQAVADKKIYFAAAKDADHEKQVTVRMGAPKT